MTIHRTIAEELLTERGTAVDHVTLYRWLQRFTPLFADAARPLRHTTGNRWFVDETYVKIAARRLRKQSGSAVVPNDRSSVMCRSAGIDVGQRTEIRCFDGSTTPSPGLSMEHLIVPRCSIVLGGRPRNRHEPTHDGTAPRCRPAETTRAGTRRPRTTWPGSGS